MSNKKNPSVDPDFDETAYRNDLSKALVQEVVKLIQAEHRNFGGDFCMQIMLDVVASLTASGLFSVLEYSAINKDSMGDKYAVTEAAFNNYKSGIEDAVAAGFQAGFSTWNPAVHPDYDCTIRCLDSGEIKGPLQ